jgi:hypothetical protein
MNTNRAATSYLSPLSCSVFNIVFFKGFESQHIFSFPQIFIFYCVRVGRDVVNFVYTMEQEKNERGGGSLPGREN